MAAHLPWLGRRGNGKPPRGPGCLFSPASPRAERRCPPGSAGLMVERVDQVFLSRAAKAQALYMAAEGMDFEDFKQVSNGAHDNDMDHE